MLPLCAPATAFRAIHSGLTVGLMMRLFCHVVCSCLGWSPLMLTDISARASKKYLFFRRYFGCQIARFERVRMQARLAEAESALPLILRNVLLSGVEHGLTDILRPSVAIIRCLRGFEPHAQHGRRVQVRINHGRIP
jgi:hypothetical protein